VGAPGRSQQVIETAIDALDVLAHCGLSVDHEAVMMALLGEAGLRENDVDALASLALATPSDGGDEPPVSPDLLRALCTHPLASPDAVIELLWHARARDAQDVGLAIGTLLGAAVAWVRAVPGSRGWWVTGAQRQQILDTASRWSAAAEGEPALAVFLATSSHMFTNENDLFAAGRAVLTAPAASARRAAGRTSVRSWRGPRRRP